MTRPSAVAGTFYPARAESLAATVDSLLEAVVPEEPRDEASRRARPVDHAPAPRAVVVPHAGYACSGPTAATAYARIDPTARVVAVLGPAHWGELRGLAVPLATSWATPLGDVTVDEDLCRELERAGHVVRDDQPHLGEHSIEVQLPFLQRVLRRGWTSLPVAVGVGPPELVADCLDALTGAADALVVTSTDLSHYYDEGTAHRLDRRTCEAVLDREPDGISRADACGADALRGLLAWARRHDLAVELLDRSTSADTCGSPSRVVGYAAFAVTGDV